MSETGSSNQHIKGCEDGQSHGEKLARKSAPVIHSHSFVCGHYQTASAFTMLDGRENGAACV